MSILREINTKNYGRYYSDGITSIKDLDLNKTLVHVLVFSFIILHANPTRYYTLAYSFDKVHGDI